MTDPRRVTDRGHPADGAGRRCGRDTLEFGRVASLSDGGFAILRLLLARANAVAAWRAPASYRDRG